MNSYELSRAFIDWAFENPHKIKPIHYAIYFFAIEHCNRLGWKKAFGLPSQMVMEAIGVKNWKTYSSALKELEDFGFIQMLERSKNQYSSNVVALVKNTKAQSKALDKALSKHLQKQGTKHSQSTVSIDKQLNNEQGTIKQRTILLCSLSNESQLSESEKITFAFWKLFKSNMLESGISKTTNLDKAKLDEWERHVRLTIELDGRTKQEFEQVWHFLKNSDFWKKNIQSTKKLREQFERLYIDAQQNRKKTHPYADMKKNLHDKYHPNQ